MTTTDKSSRKVISGSGWSNPLSHNYQIDNASHVKVFADDVELSIGDDFSVLDVGDPSGYHVIINEPAEWSPTVWVLSVEPPLVQQTDLSLGGVVGKKFEDGLDAVVRQLQAVSDLAERAVKTDRKLPVDRDPIIMDVIPDGHFHKYDAETNRMVDAGDADVIEDTRLNAEAAAASAVEASERAADAYAAAQAAQGEKEDAEAAAQTAIEARDLAVAASNAFPTGGETGQLLAKTGEGDYETGWVNPPADPVGPLFDEDLGKTPEQQAQARANIGAQYALNIVTPQMFGAVGDGVADDTVAVQAAIDDGRPLDWGSATYRVTDTISRTLTAPIKWRSSDARLLFDAATSKQYALYIAANGHDISIDGAFTIDANMKAYSAVRFDNAGAYANFNATDLRTRNHYRAALTYTGGDGIYVSGCWTIVRLKADVRNGRMATGAGDPGSQGVFGITIAQNTTGAPQDITVDCYIDDIQSEDPAYTADQDGLRIFGARAAAGRVFPWYSRAKVSGVFRNCANRSIKSQMHETVVDGAVFIREGTVLGGNEEGGEEVEFQYGAGTLTNFACFYYSARPNCVVSSAGIQTPNGIVPAGAFVSNGRIYSRGTGLEVVGRLKSYDAIYARMTMENIVVVSEVNPIQNFLYVINSTNNGQLTFAKVKDCTAPIPPLSTDSLAGWVRILGSTDVPVYVDASGLCNTHGTGGTRPLTNPQTGTNITKSLTGNNRGVVV